MLEFESKPQSKNLQKSSQNGDVFRVQKRSGALPGGNAWFWWGDGSVAEPKTSEIYVKMEMFLTRLLGLRPLVCEFESENGDVFGSVLGLGPLVQEGEEMVPGLSGWVRDAFQGVLSF